MSNIAISHRKPLSGKEIISIWNDEINITECIEINSKKKIKRLLLILLFHMTIVEEFINEDGDLHRVYKNTKNGSIEKIVIEHAPGPITARPGSAKHRVQSLKIESVIIPLDENEEKKFFRKFQELLENH